MNLLLMSNVPAEGNSELSRLLQSKLVGASVLLIPPSLEDRHRLEVTSATMRAYGARTVASLDLQAEKQSVSRVDQADVVMLTGGDPLLFSKNLRESGIDRSIVKRIDRGAPVFAASGGAMQLTPNVSIFRLRELETGPVLEERRDHAALGVVDFEILPHSNRADPTLFDRVRRYAQRTNVDLVLLADGAALVMNADSQYAIGPVERFAHRKADPAQKG